MSACRNFADYRQVNKINSHVTTGWLLLGWMLLGWLLLTFKSLQNSLGRNWMTGWVSLGYLVSPTLHYGFSDLRRSSTALSSTPTLRCLFFILFYFLSAYFFASSFLIHTHVTYGMSCHARGHHSLTQGSKWFP